MGLALSSLTNLGVFRWSLWRVYRRLDLNRPMAVTVPLSKGSQMYSSLFEPLAAPLPYSARAYILASFLEWIASCTSKQSFNQVNVACRNTPSTGHALRYALAFAPHLQLEGDGCDIKVASISAIFGFASVLCSVITTFKEISCQFCTPFSLA